MSSRFHDKRISFFILIGKNLKAIDRRSGKRLVLRAFPNENKKLVHSRGRPQEDSRVSFALAAASVFAKKPAVPAFWPSATHTGKYDPEKKQKNFIKALAVFFRSEYITATDAADMIRRTRRAISSVGRAPRLHRGCREFESLIAHHFPNSPNSQAVRPDIVRNTLFFAANFRH